MSAVKTQKGKNKKLAASAGTGKKSTQKKPKKNPPTKSPDEGVKKTTPPAEEEHGLLTEAAENIEAGAEVVGEKFSKIAEKTTETAGEVFEVIQKQLSTAYESGAKVVDEITQTAQDYIEKYQHNKEVKRLIAERDTLVAQLGLTTFVKYKTKDKSSANLLEEKEIPDLIKKIETLDKEIVKIGKKLEKEK